MAAPDAKYGSLSFQEQINFFLDKLGIPAEDYATVYGNQHDRAFVVAGATKLALIRDFQQAVGDAIKNGRTLAQFREDFDSIVEKYGWEFKGQPGWRARVIYDTNLRQAYNAGREQQMADPALLKRRPYGLYRHGDSRVPRPEHLALDGKVIPLDNPWWNYWSPQNGYGCQCKKFMLSEKDIRRLGLTVSDVPPLEFETRVIGKEGQNPRTVEVPKGIDPGFDTRPGTTWFPDLEGTETDLARQHIQGNLDDGIFHRWLERLKTDLDMVAGQEQYPVAMLDDATRQLIGADQRTVILDGPDAAQLPAIDPADLARIQDTIEKAQTILDLDGLRYALMPEGDKVYAAVLTIQDGQATVKSFQFLTPADAEGLKTRGKILRNW